MVNRVMLCGNLGCDPKVNDNGTICYLNLATSVKFRDKQTNEMTEKTTWHDVVCFGRLIEIAQKILAKGSKVFIEGHLDKNTYDKDGMDVEVYRVVADAMQALSYKDNPQDIKNEAAPRKPNYPPKVTRTQIKAEQEFYKKSPSRDDDDLPF